MLLLATLVLPILAGCRPEQPSSGPRPDDTIPQNTVPATSASQVGLAVPPDMPVGSSRIPGVSAEVGQPAPSLEGTDADGKPLKLSDYRGKVVVVDFWMIGCPPCRAMIPHEKELVKRMQGRPFVLLGVSNDLDTQVLRTFLEQEHINWPNISDSMSSQTAAWHASLATLDVIDAKGVYRYFSVKQKDLDAVVEKLVKEAESGK
jgi:peroxiredoxin